MVYHILISQSNLIKKYEILYTKLQIVNSKHSDTILLIMYNNPLKVFILIENTHK